MFLKLAHGDIIANIYDVRGLKKRKRWIQHNRHTDALDRH